MLHRLCTNAFAAGRTTWIVLLLACAFVLHGGMIPAQGSIAPPASEPATGGCCRFDTPAPASEPVDSAPKPAHDCCVKGCAACCATVTQLVTRDATIGRPLVLVHGDRPAATTRVAASSADSIFHPPRA